MLKRALVGSGMLLASVALAGASIWYIQNHDTPLGSVRSGGSPISLDFGQASSGKALEAPSPTPSSSTSDGLHVANATSDTGQLISSSGSNSNSSSSNSSATAGPPGPDAFGQYDQYKTQDKALFGELRLGDGEPAAVGKTVVVNYKGWLTNGTEFDESYARGKPFSFVIGQHRVILGWEEAILGMKVGGKRRFIVPPSVGYGATEQNGIPANSLLVFDVELLAVQ